MLARVIAFPRRVVRRLLRIAARWRFARAVHALLWIGPRMLVDSPRRAIALARVESADDRDPALAAMIDDALAHGRPASMVRRRAKLAAVIGDLSSSRDLWAELAERGIPGAAERFRLLDGRLIETDTTWLPRVPGEPEPLERVSRDRILHIVKSSVPDRWSGYTIRTLNNLRAQRAVGLEPIVVTEIGWPRMAGVAHVAPMVEVEGIAHYRLDRGPEYGLREIANDARLSDMTADLIPLVRMLQPAILHAHSGNRGGEQALVALALRERFGIPVVYEVRGLFEGGWTPHVGMAAESELYARRLAQEDRILREVDAVLVISEALVDELAARGVPREKMRLIPNGIDPEQLRPIERDPALRARLGLEGRFVVGYVGNLDHFREGIEVLIEALAELRRRGRAEVAVLVVGDGTRRARMEAHARRLGVADACRFTGRVPHDAVAQYYVQMDLFTNPRVDERAARFITPLKPYEAMALGRPVLVSDLPALHEIVDPPNRGMSSPPGDPVRLADAIERLMDDPELRARISAAGSEWVRTERTWASNGPRYRAAYDALIGPRA